MDAPKSPDGLRDDVSAPQSFWRLRDVPTAVLSAVAVLLAATPAIYLLWRLPPTWNWVDALCVGMWGTGMIPISPPGHISYTLEVLLGGAILEGKDFHKGQMFTDGGLYLLATLQHLLLIAGMVVFALVASKSGLRRILVVLCFLLWPPFFLYAHGLFAEGLNVPLAVLQCGIVCYLAMAKEMHWGLQLLVALLVLGQAQNREQGVLMAGLLPLVLFLSWLFVRRNWQEVRRLGVALVLALAVAWTTHAITDLVMRARGLELVSLWGRRTSWYFPQGEWEQHPEERDALIAQMQQRTADPLVRQVIPRMLEKHEPWTGYYAIIEDLVKAQKTNHVPSYERPARCDRILNEVCYLYLTSGHPRVRQQILGSFEKYWTRSCNAGSCVWEVVDNSARLIADYIALKLPREYPQKKWMLDGVRSIRPPQDRAAEFREIPNWLWIRALHDLVPWHIAAASLCLLALALAMKAMPGPAAVFSAACVLLAFLHVAAVSVIIPTHARFMAVPVTLCLASVAILLATFDCGQAWASLRSLYGWLRRGFRRVPAAPGPPAAG